MNQHESSLDEQLNRPGQQAVRQWVQQLPEEVPSLAWRSQLNERVRMESKRRARRRFWAFVISPTAGLAAAAALLAVVWMPSVSPTLGSVQKGSLERDLVMAHQDEVYAVDIAGSSVSPSEASRFASRTPLPVPEDGGLIELESL